MLNYIERSDTIPLDKGIKNFDASGSIDTVNDRLAKLLFKDSNLKK